MHLIIFVYRCRSVSCKFKFWSQVLGAIPFYLKTLHIEWHLGKFYNTVMSLQQIQIFFLWHLSYMIMIKH